MLKSLKDTQKLARDLAVEITTKGNPSVIALYGELGSGKTTFVQFLAKALKIKEKILSPTFVIIKNFACGDGRCLVHIDAYRLKSAKDLLALGLQDILRNKENIVVIEWPEKVEKYLPKDTIRVFLEVSGKNERKVIIKSNIKN
ncbi:MAG: tRNA (adenosine(37)-N6)-threonylcarbamoyltransferase complex ATPase subunit type 1 TsaE [Candidatus Sungbacteria bacterium]|nr:tRNA (adenosine(37)-N6)-threonylcarbamoyltransferase complex ATPase subunit type 1 TsaE [Candidatus Sungbacteria bacterium]